MASVTRQQYAVARDGRRFVMNTIVAPHASPITLLLNWRGR
jgi:hypothetical protein